MREAATTTSLTERTNTAIGNALAGRKRGAFTPLLFAGPAVIASIAYMDPVISPPIFRLVQNTVTACCGWW